VPNISFSYYRSAFPLQHALADIYPCVWLEIVSCIFLQPHIIKSHPDSDKEEKAQKFGRIIPSSSADKKCVSSAVHPLLSIPNLPLIKNSTPRMGRRRRLRKPSPSSPLLPRRLRNHSPRAPLPHPSPIRASPSSLHTHNPPRLPSEIHQSPFTPAAAACD
jgi:hypothetical protein